MNQPVRTERADDSLPLLCALGRHAPERLPVWNEGYYFARCERCKRDIVRPLDGKWEIPRGFRVVWRRERPETASTPVLVGAVGKSRWGVPLPASEAGQDEAATGGAAAAEGNALLGAAAGVPDALPENTYDDGIAWTDKSYREASADGDDDAQAAGPEGETAEPTADAAEPDIETVQPDDADAAPDIDAAPTGDEAGQLEDDAAASDGAPSDAATVQADGEAALLSGTDANGPEPDAGDTADALEDSEEPIGEPAEVPVDDVLNEPPDDVLEEPVEDVLEEPYAPGRNSLIPDFMNDGTPLPPPLRPSPPPPPPPAPVVAPAAVGAAAATANPDPVLAQSIRNELDRIGLGNLAAMSNRVFQDPDAAAGASARAARPGAGLIIAVLAAVLLTFVSTLAWERARQPAPLGAGADIYAVPKSDGRSAAESAARPDQPTSQSDRTLSPPEDRSEPSSQARPALPPRPDQPAKTVAASVANCRATPSESAEVTAKFLRGAEVRMEAQRGSWSNVSRRGQSCWVQTQLLEDS